MVDKKRMYRESKALLDRLNMDIDPDSIVSELNVAQKQMIKIAEALSRNSKLLVMDEPTASLPRHERDSLFNIIKQLVVMGFQSYT